MKVEARRCKYKKITAKYDTDNVLDIIDIEDTLSKNKFIPKAEKDNFIFQKQEERADKDKIMSQQSELSCKYQKTLDRKVNESLESYSIRLETLLNECEKLAKATGYSGRKFEPKFEL